VPAAATAFYGSILAGAAAALTGTFAVLRHAVRSRRGRAAILALGASLLGLSVIATTVAWAPTTASPSRAGQGLRPVNIGPVVNTARREAEPSFTSDGRTMYFNCNDYDICLTHLTGTWAEVRWSQPKTIGAPISSPYMDVEPVISLAGDKLYVTSDRPFGSGQGMPGL
jgi:hypothetical protein